MSQPDVAAQMVWKCREDDTYRANGGVPDEPANILTNSVNSGISYGINYMERAPTPTPAPPVILRQPKNQKVSSGMSALFTVQVSGDSLVYQWQKKDAPISDATSSTYLTPPTSSADNGSVFSVTVSNGGGEVMSRAARLRVR